MYNFISLLIFVLFEKIPVILKHNFAVTLMQNHRMALLGRFAQTSAAKGASELRDIRISCNSHLCLRFKCSYNSNFKECTQTVLMVEKNLENRVEMLTS